jgi:rod shape determining protein RodA
MERKRFYLSRIDFRLVVIVLALMCVSLLVISSSSISADLTNEPFFTNATKSQLQWFLIGSAAFIVFATIDYNKLREWTWVLYVGMIIALVGVFFTGKTHSVHRWYQLPIIGIMFQPSEFAKLIVVITISWFLERRKAKVDHISTALLTGIIVGVPFILILKQPDLGTALVVGAGFIGILSRWIPIKYWFLSLVVAGILSVPIYKYVLHDYQRSRLMTFVNPYTDPLNNGYHVIQSTIAFGSGGLWGKGLGHGTQSQLCFLPEHHTDFIFASLGEELGAVGSALVLVLYSLLLYRIYAILSVCVDETSTLFCLGVFVMLVFQIAVNIGMNIGIAPVTGVTLPFLSYGGSSMLSISACLGLVAAMRK